MTIQRKHKIRAIRPLPVENEFSAAELRELQRRYKQDHENPPTIDQLRNMPDLLDPDFGTTKLK